MKFLEHKFKAMGSHCSISLYCDSELACKRAIAICLTEMERLEAKYSRYRPKSLLSKINYNAGVGPVTIDEETAKLLNYASVAYKESDGLFDITSGVLRNVWNFKNPVIPQQGKIDQIKALIGFDRVEWSTEQIYLPQSGMEIDFGGIVKEYAADSLASRMQKQGIQHGLINLAGDIHIIGPQLDGTPWDVGISHPAKPEQSIATIPMMSGGLASSGDYQRCFEIDGTRYCHILNPKTGWPIQGLAGVSVWAEQCIVAGTLATIAMLKGETAGPEWLKTTGSSFVTIKQNFEVQYQNH